MVDGIERLLKIYCDNNSTVFYSNNNRNSIKSKFIDIKFLVVKERVQNKQISITYRNKIKLMVYVYILNLLIFPCM
ncbi:hypothetical protein CR513_12071, partial [Mucuna pruriens]